MNTSKKIYRMTTIHVVHAVEQMIRAYFWHLDNDPIYYVDRNSVDEWFLKIKSFNKSFLRMNSKNFDLKKSEDVYHFNMVSDLGYEQYQSGMNDNEYLADLYILPPNHKKKWPNSNKYPFKAATILYCLLVEIRDDLELKEYLYDVLNQSGNEESILGQIMNSVPGLDPDLSQFILPIPMDFNYSTNKNEWYTRIKLNLERSLGFGKMDTLTVNRLLSVGYKMAFDIIIDFDLSVSDFQILKDKEKTSFLYLGDHCLSGLDPSGFTQIAFDNLQYLRDPILFVSDRKLSKYEIAMKDLVV